MKLSAAASLAGARAAWVATAAHCLADANLLLAIVALPLMAAAGIVVRTSGGLALPRRLTNILLLAVLALAVVRARAGGAVVSDAVQLVIAVLVVKLFERKAARDLALILMLSVFVAIGAILTDNRLLTSVLVLASIPLVAWGVALQQLLAAQERVIARTKDEFALADAQPLEWRLVDAGGRARRDLRRLVGVLIVSSSILAVAVFVLVPRGIGMNRLSEWAGAGVGRQVGFTDKISLGTGGFIKDSSTPVLDATIREASGAKLGGPGSIYYLRGAVLDTYAAGSWTTGPGASRRSSATFQPGAPAFLDSGAGGRLTLEVTLRNAPNGRTHLFTLWRPIQAEFSWAGSFEITPASVMTVSTRGGRLDYEVQSIPSETYRGVAPVRGRIAAFPSEVLRARAASILDAAGISPDPLERPVSDDGRAARAIEQFLRSNFEYTLDAIAAPAGAHPIEWFVEESRVGHCEDFASAMAAMCRCVGLDARIITGYIAAEFNQASGHYIVRESNAHAWVEVEIGAGRWRVFDPTPPDELQSIHAPAPGLAMRARQLLDAVEYAWINSIISFDQSRQDRLFGVEPGGGRGFLGYLEALRQQTLGADRIFGALATGLVVFVATALAGFALRQLLSIRSLLGLFPLRARSSAPAWYAEFQALAARAGLPRPAWCPPGAFAEHLQRIDPELGRIGEELARQWYRQRFAGIAPGPDDIARAREAVRRAASILRKRSPISDPRHSAAPA